MIIDEVHERDIETEILLLLVKNLLSINKDIKVILMSATFEMDTLRKYFADCQLPNGAGPVAVDRMEVPNRKFKVEKYYMEDIKNMLPGCIHVDDFHPEQNLPTFSYQQEQIVCALIAEFDEQEKDEEVKGSVLIFLPGFVEIENMYRSLQRQDNRKNKYVMYKVHSTLSTHKTNSELEKLLTPPEKGKRKIILSTIICESSITVPDIRYVIDSCLTKQNMKDEALNLNQLKMVWASHENCKAGIPSFIETLSSGLWCLNSYVRMTSVSDVRPYFRSFRIVIL